MNNKSIRMVVSLSLNALFIAIEKGLISDEKIFYFQVKLSDYKDKFKAGTYSLNTGMKPTDMMKILAGISTTDTGDSE